MFYFSATQYPSVAALLSPSEMRSTYVQPSAASYPAPSQPARMYSHPPPLNQLPASQQRSHTYVQPSAAPYSAPSRPAAQLYVRAAAIHH